MKKLKLFIYGIIVILFLISAILIYYNNFFYIDYSIPSEVHAHSNKVIIRPLKKNFYNDTLLFSNKFGHEEIMNDDYGIMIVFMSKEIFDFKADILQYIFLNRKEGYLLITQNQKYFLQLISKIPKNKSVYLYDSCTTSSTWPLDETRLRNILDKIKRTCEKYKVNFNYSKIKMICTCE